MYEKIEEHNKGVIGTILFHVVVLLIVLFLGFTTPLPLPEEEGILINFGTDEDGFGLFEPSRPSVQQTASAVQPTTSDDPEIMTQEIEEAPAVATPKPQAKVEPRKEPERKPEVAEVKPIEQPKVEEVPERQVDQRALFPGRTTNPNDSRSEGVTTGTGNQGSPVGSPDSGSRVGGESMGTDGISFSLSGRTPRGELPKPDYNIQREGIVVVEITVDKNGNVTNAIPGVRGSTTINETLLTAARNAAMRAKFNDIDMPAFQKGTITYHFKLQ